jgi:hypothetical protein
MGPGDKRLEYVVLTRIIRLNATVQGLVTGPLGGLVIFVATNWLVLNLVGFAYGFAAGFAAGYFVAIVAIVYNLLVLRRARA